VFSCGYRPREIEDYFGDGSSRGIEVGYVVDPEPLGTAGAIANAGPLLADDDVFVLNGDILTDLDLAALVQHHRQLGAEASIALTPVDDPSAFGLVRTDAEGRVFVPPMSIKNALSDIAKYLSVQIPGKGKATYTKHVEAGVLLMEPMYFTPTILAKDVAGEWLYVPSDGRRGGSKRVEKCFPVIPAGWQGVVGVQTESSRFSAVGDEAFAPFSRTRSQALFVQE
jgi:hypothetical protein